LIRGYLAHDAHARIRVLLSLLVVTPLGFLLKLYAGSARGWFNYPMQTSEVSENLGGLESISGQTVKIVPQ